jgi:uncharacterized membrane protein YadS
MHSPYAQCGLVLLGVDLEKVVSMGFKGMVVGWVVPPLQIIFMWLIGTRVLKLDNKVMVMVLAIGASVCGCSAMAAAAPALNMKKVILFSSLVTGLPRRRISCMLWRLVRPLA